MNDVSAEDRKPPAAAPAGALTQGSTLRHVVVMTGTASVGLIAIFLVDFLSLFYISLLRNEQWTAGVGYATTVMFFTISVNIGLMIAGSALIARALGARDVEKARRVSGSSTLLLFTASLIVSVAMLVGLDLILDALGAAGEPRAVAERFLWISMLSNPLMAVGMSLSGVLRAAGDPRRAMMVTLLGGLATAALDPLFIFAFGMGTDGAALATVFSRLIFCVVGFRGVVKVHRLMARPTLADLRRDIGPLLQIALPAVATNIASPVAAGFMISVIRQFGHEAVTASTIIDRLIPLAFGVIFALSGSIGPILAQNLGARRHDRVQRALKEALILAGVYSLVAWAVLALARHQVAALFGASDKTAAYVAFFCLVGAGAWVFNALLFVANSAFNNLGFPLYSTFFNWGRATLGTMPFCYFGAQWWGYEGAIGLVAVGWAIFGIWSVIQAFRSVRLLEQRAKA